MKNKHPDGKLLWSIYCQDIDIIIYINYYGTKVFVLFYPREPLVSNMEKHKELYDEFIREIINSFCRFSPWI